MKCILHIGTEKTATSTIQQFLYRNRAELSAQGVALSDCLGQPDQRKFSAFFSEKLDDFHQIHGIHSKEDNVRYFDGFWDKFKAEADDLRTSHDRLIISSEHLHSRLHTVAEIENVKRHLDEIFEDVVVICYFRRQEDLILSSYSTFIKGGSGTLPLSEFAKWAQPGVHYFDYHLSFGKWCDVFGKPRLIPVIFDQANFFDGEIQKDFIHRTCPHVDLDTLTYIRERQNESLGVSGILIGRLFNRIYPRFRNGVEARYKKRLMRLLTLSPLSRIGRLRLEDKAAVIAAFAETNTRFSKEYFDFDGDIFHRNGP